MTPRGPWDTAAIVRKCLVCEQWRQLVSYAPLQRVCNKCVSIARAASPMRGAIRV